MVADDGGALRLSWQSRRALIAADSSPSLAMSSEKLKARSLLSSMSSPALASVQRNEKFGFALSNLVNWTSSDGDIPAGTVGTVIGFTEERVRVKFLNDIWTFQPAELVKVGSVSDGTDKLGLRIGDDVRWTAADKDIVAGSIGQIIGFRDDRVRVRFANGTWTFKPQELIKVNEGMEAKTNVPESPTKMTKSSSLSLLEMSSMSCEAPEPAPDSPLKDALGMTRKQLAACGRRASAPREESLLEDLQMNADRFDPTCPQMSVHLLSMLGIQGISTIEREQHNCGGINHGVWNLSGNNTARRLTMKLVDSHRRHPTLPTDAEKFVKLASVCPQIVRDPSLAFPIKIFMLRRPRGGRGQDLIVMPQAAGNQLTVVITHKWHNKEQIELLRIFKRFGKFLHAFHRDYKGMQHGDCQPSNVFYDASTGNFTLIDIAGMGHGQGETDVAQFTQGLKMMTQWYGRQFMAQAEKHFRAGYYEDHRCQAGSMTSSVSVASSVASTAASSGSIISSVAPRRLVCSSVAL